MKPSIWAKARRAKLPSRRSQHARGLAVDSRQRLSSFWAPTGGITAQDGDQDDSHSLLIRGGYLRQAHSGVFHLLPLGLRVQNKLEALIDKHMRSIGASKLSLSSITTEELWKKSGRFSGNAELLRLKDRKDSGFLLAPTHEEEITSLVSGMVHSYKDLPLRLYQTGRKYRDERRPRQGLLRAKEFMMKDLYTFDFSHQDAIETYESVRKAYKNLFDELKLPYMVADADSGNMGGKLSHEYHFVSEKGEDKVWSCDLCDYVANEELVEKRELATSNSKCPPIVFTGITMDRQTAVQIHVPRPPNMSQSQQISWNQVCEFVNLHAVKRLGVDLDTGVEPSTLTDLLSKVDQTISVYDRTLSNNAKYDLTIVEPGDGCPRCESGKLSVQKAIEVGHTFHLGTRYSEPLQALVVGPGNSGKMPIHMGCHGIGVSRLIGAVIALLADAQRLNWPRVIAPFETVVITAPTISQEDGNTVYDALSGGTGHDMIDVVMDDRPLKSIAWKMKDADLIGYPVSVILGKAWANNKEVEVQCQRLGVKKDVRVETLRAEVLSLLQQL